MDYYKVLISIPNKDIGDIKWPLTQEQYVTLATGNTMSLPQDMYEVFACQRDDLLCTAVWDPVESDWLVPVTAEQAASLYTQHGREPGSW
jgi:hypothetical protein